MKKRTIGIAALLMILVMAFLTACGSGNDKPKDDDGKENVGSLISQVFVYKDTEIKMKEDAAPILAVLGDPKSYTEAQSCAFEGLDKTYYFGSFYLYTYPDGEMDRVNMVVLCDDTVSTQEGLSIGDNKEKVESLYGADTFNGVNAYEIKGDGSTLTIIMENDKVSSIQYMADFE